MSETIDGLKQRLVGAFVIITLAIIFLPMIFDKPHSERTVTVVPVPPKPGVETVVIKKPEKPVFKELVPAKDPGKVVAVDAAPIDEAPVPATVQDTASKDDKVGSKDNDSAESAVATESKEARPGLPQVSQLPVFQNVWMVQLGTFGNTDNAYRLRDQLRSDGFDSHTKEIEIDGKKAIRVFSGPFVNKQLAEKAKARLDAKYKVKSLVLFFDP